MTNPRTTSKNNSPSSPTTRPTTAAPGLCTNPATAIQPPWLTQGPARTAQDPRCRRTWRVHTAAGLWRPDERPKSPESAKHYSERLAAAGHIEQDNCCAPNIGVPLWFGGVCPSRVKFPSESSCTIFEEGILLLRVNHTYPPWLNEMSAQISTTAIFSGIDSPDPRASLLVLRFPQSSKLIGTAGTRRLPLPNFQQFSSAY